MKYYLNFLLILTLNHCFVLNEAGLNANNDIRGSEAKKSIAEAIKTAEISALNIYLANNGMSGGISAIASLVVVNGLLAEKLYPFVSKIEDGSYYTPISVLQCVEDIKGKGAISLGLAFSELPSSGLGGPLRDAILLPEFASCEIEKTGSLLGIPKVIDL
jgi:small lipoprotein (TIGR04452 family)